MYMHMHMHTYIHARAHAHMQKNPLCRICIRVYSTLCARARVLHIYTCVCVCMYIYIHTHTCTNTVEDSEELLEEKVEVKQPIQQNAIGGKGVYLNTHQVKRSMTLSAFKKNAMKQENLPPMPDSTGYTPEALRESFFVHIHSYIIMSV
jgi:hypothetical protein